MNGGAKCQERLCIGLELSGPVPANSSKGNFRGTRRLCGARVQFLPFSTTEAIIYVALPKSRRIKRDAPMTQSENYVVQKYYSSEIEVQGVKINVRFSKFCQVELR